MAATSAESGVTLTLGEVAKALDFECLTPELPDDRPVAAGYATDLLSDVLAHAPRGGLFVTVQAHLHALAVAVHANQVGVVFALGRHPGEDVLRRAVEQGVSVYASPDTVFNIVGRLYALGLRGDSK
jgi:hypothetical protein